MTDYPLTILVVDDEAELAYVIGMILRSQGHQVYTAENGARALAYMRDDGIHFDILITDYRLKEMNGVELIRMLRGEQPELPAIGMSGIPDAEIQFSRLGLPFLLKPLDWNEMFNLLRRASSENAAADPGAAALCIAGSIAERQSH